jgi:hypothetical protein
VVRGIRGGRVDLILTTGKYSWASLFKQNEAGGTSP